MRIIRGRWLSEATAGDKPPALQNTNEPCNNRTTPNVNTLGKIRHSVYGQPQNQRHIIDEEKRSFSTTTLRSNISHRAKRDISRIPKGMPFSFCVSKTFHSKAELSLPHTPQIRTIQSMKKSDFRSFSTSILHSQLSILNYRKAPLFHQTPLIFPVFSKTLQIILRKNHLDG